MKTTLRLLIAVAALTLLAAALGSIVWTDSPFLLADDIIVWGN